MRELEDAIAGFVSLYREGDGPDPADATRALFRARLEDHAARPGRSVYGFGLLSGLNLPGALVPVVLMLLVVLVFFVREGSRRYAEPAVGETRLLRPDPDLTAGATRGVSLDDVCRVSRPAHASPLVPLAVARDVFAEYGIRDAGERAYELDYLIPPELGGSDDTWNLWPQAYSTPVWNAHVKDALEDHLHRLVCRGELSLAAAQMEISADWIAAYRKHFGTDYPISDHLAYLKDEPWNSQARE
jgi:hypothetical protein